MTKIYQTGFDITFLEKEGPVWVSTLRPQGVWADQPQQIIKDYLKHTPKSHKWFAFTIKVVAEGLYTFLNNDTDYYHHVMVELIQKFPHMRNTIWVEELDSKRIRHIHGILTHTKREPISYSAIQEHLVGMHIYFRKIFKTSEKWIKYITKVSTKINIVQFGRIKIYPKDMTICHTKKDTENEDLAEITAKEVADILQPLPKL